MNRKAMQRLMAAILAEQPESADAGIALDEARLRRALSGAEPLSQAEQRLLWTSPAARWRLTMLWVSERAAQYLAWHQAGIAPQIAYLAASDAAVQPVTIDTHPHFTIKLFPLDTDGKRWTIFLKLSDTAHQTLLTGIRLVDTGGLLWLAGPVDGDGELSVDWPHPEPPLQRLHRYELRVEPLVGWAVCCSAPLGPGQCIYEGDRVTTKVLVVDDEKEICTLFEAMLSQYGCYQVVTTTDGRQVMDILRRKPFNVVLLDMRMPAITSSDLLRQITQAFEALPVIIVTGHGSIETAVESMQAGAAYFVTKPVPAAVLHITIQKVLEYAHTRRLASTDGLTDLYNYRTFQERLVQEVDRANRYARPLSLVMIDVDHFKIYNDTYGHPQGDIVLRELARLLREVSRTSDIVARYGGEEFALILPETDRLKAQKMGHRLREHVERHAFPGEDRLPRGALTISVGVTTHTLAGTKEALVQSADDALYRAKRAGRNRVCVAGE